VPILEKFLGVSRLEGRLTEAIATRDAKQAALNSLLLEDPDGSKVMSAEMELTAASRRVLSLQGAIAAAQDKQAAAQVEAAQQAQRDHEQKILQAAEARHAAGKALAQSSKQFANDYLKLLLANESLAALLPPDRDIFADLTERSTLETMLRRNLAKLGLPWAFPCPFGTVDIPELPAQLEAALGVVRRSVPKDSQK
jgi:hypothetical protein